MVDFLLSLLVLEFVSIVVLIAAYRRADREADEMLERYEVLERAWRDDADRYRSTLEVQHLSAIQAAGMVQARGGRSQGQPVPGVSVPFGQCAPGQAQAAESRRPVFPHVSYSGEREGDVGSPARAVRNLRADDDLG